jgi:hypothetical protein
MSPAPDILCIGSCLWDIIGRTPSHMRLGADVPGRITRVPGGVAMNIAMTLRRFGLRPALLTAIGRDPEGDQLVDEAARLGLVTDFAYRSEDLPTDRYMAVEGGNGLVAAIADAHSLEAAGDKILRPLADGRWAPEGPGPAVASTATSRSTSSRDRDLSPLRSGRLRSRPQAPERPSVSCPPRHPAPPIYVNLEEAGSLPRDSPLGRGAPRPPRPRRAASS